MKLGSRCSTSELHSSLFLLIFFLDLKLGYLQQYAVVECDWSVQRLSCPPYATTDWVCLQAQLNCTNGAEYHCLRDESGEWTEICAKPIACSKGQEPVLKNSQIVCSNCKNPERYEPVDGTESYKYSECRRIKTSCRWDVSYECVVDEAVRHAQNRQCRCDNEKGYMPQNYDLNSDTWICKEPNDLNCIHAPCPEDVYGNAQTRGLDYRCFVDPNRPSTPGPSQRPSDRSSTVAITENHATRFSHNGDTEADPVTSPILVIILVIVSSVALLGLSIAIVLCKAMECYLCSRKNKNAMPEGPLEVTEIQYRQMSLSWKPPKILPTETHREPLVIHYVITQVQGNTRDWVEVTTTKETSCKVIDLEPGTFYNFGVRAKYETGISSPLTTQRMYQTKCLTVPGKPHGLMFCQITTSYITLAWEPPAEDGGTPVTGYVVNYCNTSDNVWTKGQFLEDDITMWKQENLLKGKEYTFQVTARNKVGESDPLESENTVMLLREPSKPEDLSVNDIMCNEVTLSWNAPEDDGGTDLLYYHIRLKKEGSVWQNILNIRSGVPSIKIKKLQPEHTYYFGVCAENKVGEGEFCDTVKPTKLPKRLGPPDSPSGPLECLNVDYTELILSWKPPQYDGGFPLTGYKVQAKGSSGYYKTETTVSSNTTMYHVKNLKDGSNYRFKVYAVNEKGSSDDALESTEVITKTICLPGIPEGPLEAVDITYDALTLVWNKPLDDGGFPIQRYRIETKGFAGAQVFQNDPEKTRYRISKLKEGTSYQFRVRAVNKKGAGDYVEKDVMTRTAKDRPSRRSSHSEKDVIDSNSQAILPFTPQRQTSVSSQDSGFVSQDTLFSKPTTPLPEIQSQSTPQASERPEYTSPKSRVSKSESSASSESKGASQVPSTQPLQTSGVPDIPSGPIEITKVTSDSVTLKWAAPEDKGYSPLVSYKVYKTHDKKGWKRLEILDPSLTYYTAIGLKEGKTYKFSVIAKNQQGKGERLVSEPVAPYKKGNAGVEAYYSDSNDSSKDGAEKNTESSEDLKKEKEAEDFLLELKSKQSWDDFLKKATDINHVLDDSFHIPSRVTFRFQGKPEYEKRVVDIPHGFTAFEASDNGNSLYNSVSLILFGNENYASRLRLAAAKNGIQKRTFYIQQFFKGKDEKSNETFMKNCLSETSLKELGQRKGIDSASFGDFVTKMAVRETAMPQSKCNPLQVQFLSSASGFPIKQHFEKGTQNFYEHLNSKPELLEPAGKKSEKKSGEGDDCCIHILWVLEKELAPKSTTVVNRIIPLIDNKCVKGTPV